MAKRTIFVQPRNESILGPLVCRPLCHGSVQAGDVISVSDACIADLGDGPWFKRVWPGTHAGGMLGGGVAWAQRLTVIIGPLRD